MRASGCNAIRKPLGIELGNVLTPILLVLVHHSNCEFNRHALGNEQFFQVQILIDHSRDYRSRWEGSQGLVEDHPHHFETSKHASVETLLLVADHLQNLLASTVLPLGMQGQHEHREADGVRHRVLPCHVEQLAVVEHRRMVELHGVFLPSLTCSRQHAPQKESPWSKKRGFHKRKRFHHLQAVTLFSRH